MCDDYEHKADLITPNTIAMDSDGNTVAEVSPNVTEDVAPASSTPVQDASGAAVGSGPSNLDDDVVDDETKPAPPAAPVKNEEAKPAAETPVSAALIMAETRATVLDSEVSAMLASCGAGKIRPRANAEVAGYLKMASEISKDLHASQGSGAKHDAFLAKLRKSIEGTMSKIEKITGILEKQKQTSDTEKGTGNEYSGAITVTSVKTSFTGV
jgi:hypothetical protein